MGRISWKEYFMNMANLVATRSTCRALNVGAVIVKDNQVLATGYNGAPSKVPHCTDTGHCSPGLSKCTDNSSIPSLAIHAEMNAIAQAAKYGISIQGATLYVTHKPCISCLKTILATGMTKIIYAKDFQESDEKKAFREYLLFYGLIEIEQLHF